HLPKLRLKFGSIRGLCISNLCATKPIKFVRLSLTKMEKMVGVCFKMNLNIVLEVCKSFYCCG
ncbi:MAG: hypothetical protein ACN6OV_11155, partial [Acinetobacter sp.]|uniref:hypothetical protein n=1 Tax=Acinetobacter sp. TaxID=472 RepID=UPI003D02E7C4